MRHWPYSVALIAVICVGTAASEAATRKAKPAVKAVAADKPLKITPARSAIRVQIKGRSALKPPRARSTFGLRRSLETVAPAVPIGLILTDAQRETIYQSIVQAPLRPKAVPTQRVERTTTGSAVAPSNIPDNEPPPARATEPELAVGAAVPAEIPLQPLPPEAADGIPAIAAYRYAFVGDRVVLVDPSNDTVVAVLRP